MNKDYGQWPVSDLKKELRKRNAKTTGKKAVLVERLADYDKLFGPLITDPDTVFKIIVPPPESFRDVTADAIVPAYNSEDLQLFTQLTERNDINSARNMYQEYFLMSCRLAFNTDFFFTGMVASEMRKNIIYNVTIKIQNHLILEAQCECAAGMGPYAQCKHILVLILGIIDLSQNKNPKIKSSQTSKLQTFHRPARVHTGDPIMSQNLVLKSNDSNLKKMVTYDPRPTIESKEAYIDFFFKTTANFACKLQSTTTTPDNPMNMSITQILKPGDKCSIFSDHDYLERTKEEEFLQNLLLTEANIYMLEEKTRTDKSLWKSERLKRLHSSSFGKICKAKSGHMTIAKNLTKNIEICTVAIKHGIKYELEAIKQFESIMKISTLKCGIVVFKDHQYLATTPDRLVGENSVLEVKCPYTAFNLTISPESVPYLYLSEKTGLLKLQDSHDYYYQVQGQMMCTGRKTAYFCIYTSINCKIIKIERDDDFITAMFEKLKMFYNLYFKNVLIQKYLYNKK